MVREEECPGDNVPGSIPRELLLINKNAHELRNGERRVGLESI